MIFFKYSKVLLFFICQSMINFSEVKTEEEIKQDILINSYINNVSDFTENNNLSSLYKTLSSIKHKIILYYLVKEFLITYAWFNDWFVIDFSSLHNLKDYCKINDKLQFKEITKLVNHYSNSFYSLPNIDNVLISEWSTHWIFIFDLKYKTKNINEFDWDDCFYLRRPSENSPWNTMYHIKKMSEFSDIIKRLENDLDILSYDQEISLLKGDIVFSMIFNNEIRPELKKIGKDWNISLIKGFLNDSIAHHILNVFIENKKKDNWLISEIRIKLREKWLLSDNEINNLRDLDEIFKSIKKEDKKLFFPLLIAKRIKIRWFVTKTEYEEVQKQGVHK